LTARPMRTEDGVSFIAYVVASFVVVVLLLVTEAPEDDSWQR